MMVNESIYDEIKAKLNEAVTLEEMKEAYKWLAEEFFHVNEGAKSTEEYIKNTYGQAHLDNIIYRGETPKASTNGISALFGAIYREPNISITEYDKHLDKNFWDEEEHEVEHEM